MEQEKMKKLITGIILTLIFGAVVYGAINRTQALYGKSTGFANQSASPGTNLDNIGDEKDTVTLLAVAETISNGLWVLRLDDNTTLEIEGRTLSYLITNNFQASPGARFSLVGFYETPGSFEISEITNLDSGEILRVRDSFGKPAWGSGGGSH